MSAIAAELFRFWRIVATGFCFAVFGLGGVFLSVSWFPLIRLVTWDAALLRSRIQRSMHHAFRLFVGLMRLLGPIDYRVQHRERLLTPGRLVVASHPSLIDVVYLISLMPEVDCIMKPSIERNVFMRWPARWAQYITRESPQELINCCVSALHAGRSLIVFPEGTRSVLGQPLRLKRGAAQIALAAGCEILPVTITCDPPSLTKTAAWWQVPARRPLWNLHVGEPFRPASVVGEGLNAPQAARRLTQHFHDLFSAGQPPIISAS